MRPCLVLIAFTTSFASPLVLAQHAGSHAATPAIALAARPATASDSTAAPAPKSQSAFGRAMAELTRSVRESKQPARVGNVEQRADNASSAAVPSAQEQSNPVVATSTRSDL